MEPGEISADIVGEIAPEANATNNSVSVKEIAKTSHRSKKVCEARARAIDNFINGKEDPEYNVQLMSNGKYRCSKRKDFVAELPPPPNNPINVNQVIENKHIIEENSKSKANHNKEHDPLKDIIYYNMSNQISEQLNKRLDVVTNEIERLRNKNKKLKNKYKNLKQAIYVTDDEDEFASNDAANTAALQTPIEENSIQSIQLPQKFQRNIGLNFNRFFE